MDEKSKGRNGDNIEAYEKDAADPSFFQRVFRQGTYDMAFLGTLGSIYVNGGMKILYSLVLREIFRTYYKIELDEL